MGGDLLQQYPALSGLVFYGTICLLKTLFMAFLTVRTRMAKKAFANKEDAKQMKGKVDLNDPDVERIKRIHLNDLENVPPFLLIGFFYVLTYPSPWIALWHFRIFTVSRLLHSFVYLYGVQQPFRFVFFSVGFIATISMSIQVLLVMAWPIN